MCAYCGAVGRVTPDHVPPENLFAAPRVGLITVPCCESCRQGTSLDDEYLRIALSRRDDSRAHPSLVALQPNIDRGLERTEAKGLAARIERETEAESYTTAGGLIVSGLWLTPDFAKLARVMERITRGLYFREHQRRVPREYQLTIVAEPALPWIDNALRHVRAKPPVVVGAGREFSYGWHSKRRAADDAEVAVWLLTFYQAVSFVVMVTKPDGPPHNYWLDHRPW